MKVTARETLKNWIESSNLSGPVRVTTHTNAPAKTTMKETIGEDNRPGIATHSKGQAYTTNPYTVPGTSRQDVSTVEYSGQAHGRTVGGYSVTDTVAPETTKQYTSNVSYTGIAEGELKPMSYSDIYNATLNEIKEEISKGRTPTQTSIKQGTNTTHIGMVEEKESLEQRSSMNVTPLQNNMYGSESITMTTDKCQYDTNSRLENTDLEAYKTNPYTQPLNSSA